MQILSHFLKGPKRFGSDSVTLLQFFLPHFPYFLLSSQISLLSAPDIWQGYSRLRALFLFPLSMECFYLRVWYNSLPIVQVTEKSSPGKSSHSCPPWLLCLPAHSKNNISFYSLIFFFSCMFSEIMQNMVNWWQMGSMYRFSRFPFLFLLHHRAFLICLSTNKVIICLWYYLSEVEPMSRTI